MNAKRDVICGECGDVICEQEINDEAIHRDDAEGFYFQWHAREDLRSHIDESKAKHSGSTSEIQFGEWKN